MPLSCAHVHPFCLTYLCLICATYLPGKCSWSGLASTTKFTNIKGGRGSHVHANPFCSA